MNNLDHFFNQTQDNDKIVLPQDQKDSIEKHFEFVKGSDFFKGY